VVELGGHVAVTSPESVVPEDEADDPSRHVIGP